MGVVAEVGADGSQHVLLDVVERVGEHVDRLLGLAAGVLDHDVGVQALEKQNTYSKPSAF